VGAGAPPTTVRPQGAPLSDNDLDRILAALGADRRAPTPDRPVAGLEVPLPRNEPRPRGRPPALTPAQVRSIRRRRALPLADRPRLDALAAEFRVDRTTIRRALQGVPPYDFGEPAPRVGGPHRNRGSRRFPRD
jgi:hypothetical protein